MLGRSAQLYVGSTYTLEVAGTEALEYAHVDFEVLTGKQTVELELSRVSSAVRAILTMRPADSEVSWLHSLAVPYPTAYRLVHKRLGIDLVSDVLPRTKSHTLHLDLPREGVVFADETYELQVGYQAQLHVSAAQEALGALLGSRQLVFNGAGDEGLPALERAWSVSCLFDDAQL